MRSLPSIWPITVCGALIAVCLVGILACGTGLFLHPPGVRRVAAAPEALPVFAKTALRACAP